METAKDLAFKAWCDALILVESKFMPMDKAKERFENWWQEWYSRQEHKNSFHPEHNIYVNGKRYIQAE